MLYLSYFIFSFLPQGNYIIFFYRHVSTSLMNALWTVIFFFFFLICNMQECNKYMTFTQNLQSVQIHFNVLCVFKNIYRSIYLLLYLVLCFKEITSFYWHVSISLMNALWTVIFFFPIFKMQQMHDFFTNVQSVQMHFNVHYVF